LLTVAGPPKARVVVVVAAWPSTSPGTRGAVKVAEPPKRTPLRKLYRNRGSTKRGG
jgi:hypothetical protein